MNHSAAYQFAHFSRRFSADQEGSALIEPDTGRFIYYFRATNEHYRVRKQTFRAAAFDGHSYWRAKFGKEPTDDDFKRYVPTVSAERLTVYSGTDWPGENDDPPEESTVPGHYRPCPTETGWPLAQEFAWEAPLHGLLYYIHGEHWDKLSLVAAFKGSPWGREVPRDEARRQFPSQFELLCDSLFFEYDPWPPLDDVTGEFKGPVGPGWRFVVELDDKVPAIRAAHVTYPGPWMGGWPFPTSGDYMLIREDDAPEIPPDVFDYRRYVDAQTEMAGTAHSGTEE